MEFSKLLQTFLLEEVQLDFEFGEQHALVVSPKDGTSPRFFPLLETPLFIQVQTQDEVPIIELGHGILEQPMFIRTIQAGARMTSVSISQDYEVIGMGDMRDVRMAYQFDIKETFIALLSDGMFLEFFAPANLEDGFPKWYREQELPFSSSFDLTS